MTKIGVDVIRATKRGLLYLAIALITVRGLSVETQQPVMSERRVLMIGNSLTSANELPSMIEVLANATGTAHWHVEAIAVPGASLSDQLRIGTAIRAIQKNRWDWVVLQQGPSALPESRVSLVRDSESFAPAVRSSGATPALYMVWPAAERAFDFDRVRESYLAAATQIHGKFLPAGEALRVASNHNPRLALRAADGFHPSVEGSYLAALVITSGICNCPISNLPSEFRPGSGDLVSIPSADLVVLRQSADEVLQRFGHR